MSEYQRVVNQSRPQLFSKKRNRPYATILIFLIVWGFFIYGLSEVNFDRSRMSLTTPLSPSNRIFWFMSVSLYPSCHDLRMELWRLVSMQIVHNGFMHIGGNSLGLLTYGITVESYFHLKSVGLFVVFQLSVAMGAIAQNFMYPYEGLVGCSAGVYGIVGLSLALLIMDYENMDEISAVVLSFVFFAQAIGDIASFFYLHNSNTGYTAHLFGFTTGLLLGLASYVRKEERWRKALAVLALCCLVVQVVFFIESYATHWPPEIYQTSYRSSSNVLSCCLDYFNLVDEGYNPDQIREDYVCIDHHLYSIYGELDFERRNNSTN